ncbi:hypothetical protein [Jiulongibacter sp. NS-SX5]|uniref:hypothetical protein n=1 Tax=Jiulongibacter sp. NS-SX5 TaxID=3463854 RepID=UPI004058147C
MNNKDQHSDKAYFEELEKSILAKVEGNQNHLPLDIAHPFQAPEGYFDSLEDQVFEKTLNQREASVFKTVWKSNQRWIRAAAAIILVGVTSLFFLLNGEEAEASELALTDFETETLVAYLENEQLDVEDFELVVDDAFELESDLETQAEELTEEELLEFIDLQYSNDI